MPHSSVVLQRQTFRKTERLSKRKIIEEIVLKGKSIAVPPLKLNWLEHSHETESLFQAAFTVPKKNFKRAPDRNKIKRRMREAYRKNKSSLYSLIPPGNTHYALLFVYTGKSTVSYTETEEKTKIILNRLVEDIQKNCH